MDADDSRLWVKAQTLSNTDLMDVVEFCFRAEPIPPCRVCGGPLTIGSMGGGHATKWGCDGRIEDPERPDAGVYADGRTIADEHYAQSQWTQHRSGDIRVVELVERMRVLDAANTKIQTELRTLRALIDGEPIVVLDAPLAVQTILAPAALNAVQPVEAVSPSAAVARPSVPTKPTKLSLPKKKARASASTLGNKELQGPHAKTR